jgi:hypothetical protein
VTTTENTATVIEGEIVDETQGPQADAAAPDAAPLPPRPKRPQVRTPPQVPRPARRSPTSELTEKQARTLTDKIKKGLNGAADTTDKLNKQVEDAAELMAEAYSQPDLARPGRDELGGLRRQGAGRGPGPPGAQRPAERWSTSSTPARPT